MTSHAYTTGPIQLETVVDGFAHILGLRAPESVISCPYHIKDDYAGGVRFVASRRPRCAQTMKSKLVLLRNASGRGEASDRQAGFDVCCKLDDITTDMCMYKVNYIKPDMS